MRIVWVGFHEEGRYCIPKLHESGFSIEAIITLDEEELKKRSSVFDYSFQSEKYSIPIYKVNNINDSVAVEIISNIKPDVICVIGWSQILSAHILDQADLVIGAHASLLPHNRGSAPINWSLINGEKITGNTLMSLNSGVDTGDILHQTSFNITIYDSCKTLYEKVARSNANMLVEVLNKYSTGLLIRKKQKIGDEVLLPRRAADDGEIDWSKSSADIYNFIRALTSPYPGAFGYIKGQKIIILDAAYNDNLDTSNQKYGSIVGFNYSFKPELCSVDVSCSLGFVTIYKIVLSTNKILFGESLIDFFKLNERFDYG